MKYFLWKIAGGDCELLEKSGTVSQRNFWLIGLLYLMVNFIVYVSFLGLFYGVFKNVFISLLGSLVLGFLVTNIYRLNLMSLEPRTLPVVIEPSSMVLTHFLRYTTIGLFAFFVSKCFEMLAISFFEEMSIINYSGSDGYLFHMEEMNKTQPWVWIITTGVMVLFLTPIYLKHRLHRSMEYYSIKERRDIRLVLEDYKRYKEIHVHQMQNVYKMYVKVGQNRTYTEPKKLYSDEPFNTKRIISESSYKTGSDFLNDILSS